MILYHLMNYCECIVW